MNHKACADLEERVAELELLVKAIREGLSDNRQVNDCSREAETDWTKMPYPPPAWLDQ